jgi:N-acetylglucosaminyldiphosphoundecaprenol N-acetyl-beta-D-mannosaminyltransferase
VRVTSETPADLAFFDCGPPGRTFAVDGWRVNIPNMAMLLERILSQLKCSAASFMVCTLNLDHLVKLRGNGEFRSAYARAQYVTADGFPIVALARLAGCAVERTTGADLIDPVCALAARHRLPVFLVGTTLPALGTCASRLANRHPGLDIRGAFVPPRAFDPACPLAHDIIDLVHASGARICFVALGAPRQELFAATAIERTAGICFLPIGAGLDFIAGTQKRSPRMLQRMHLEWAWRLALDPARLWKRYARCVLVLLDVLARRRYVSTAAQQMAG